MGRTGYAIDRSLAKGGVGFADRKYKLNSCVKSPLCQKSQFNRRDRREVGIGNEIGNGNLQNHRRRPLQSRLSSDAF